MRHVRTLMLGASAILMMVPLSIPAADAANGGDIEAAPIEATLPDGRTVGEAATADLMDALVAKIYALPDQAGFAGVTVDGTARTVTLQWKGEPPATGLEEVRAAADDGSIRLVVRATDFSESEIMDAGRLLFQKFDGAPERPSAFHGTPTRDGLIVTVAKTVVEKVGKTELQNQFRSIVAIPVTVEARDIFPASRQNDASNWSGGAAMISTAPEPEFCSTGFAVLDGVYGRLLSAAHCDFTGDYSWYDGTDSDIFTYGGSYVDIKKSGWDSMLIDPVGGTQGKIYTGSLYSNTKTSVAGTSPSAVGASACTSGANSGEHCGTIIDSNYGFDCGPNDEYLCYGVIAQKTTGGALLVRGDSGGPVYAYQADGRVKAKGIISKGGGDVACPPFITEPGDAFTTGCYNYLVYVGIDSLLSVWGVAIETSA